MAGPVSDPRSVGFPDPGVSTATSTVGEPEDRAPLSIVTAAGAGWLSSRPGLLRATRLGELAAALLICLLTLHPGRSGATPALWGLVVASLSWLVWIVGGERRALGTASLIVMAAAGGVMTASREAGVMFVGISASAAASSVELPVAIAIACPAAIGWGIASSAQGSFPRYGSQLCGIALLGIVGGTGRRQLLQRGRQVELLATAEQRAEIARREADLLSAHLAERNRLGREVHDLLAHTLGAVSIQLTALDSRVAVGDATADVRERIAAIHRLVGDGLGEARDAVRALRAARPSLDGQLRTLCELHGAALEVRGRPAGVELQPSLALYRAVQEALTNAAKHAPDARITVRLTFAADAVDVRVDNARSPRRSESPLADSGGGHGLQGMRERLELVGGRLEAGPSAEGWRVHATVPTR